MAITRRDVDDLYTRVQTARDYIRGMRDPQSEKASDVKNLADNSLVAAGEAGIGGALLGFLYGRTNHWNVPGTPLPWGVAVGAAGLLLDYFGEKQGGWLGAIGPHAANAGAGALASYTTMLGAGWGRERRAAAGEPIDQPITAGVGVFGARGVEHHRLPPHTYTAPSTYAGPGPMTEAELAARASAARW
jgi:hypothetical protein